MYQTLAHGGESGTKTMGMGSPKNSRYGMHGCEVTVDFGQLQFDHSHSSNNCASEIDHRLKHKEYE